MIPDAVVAEHARFVLESKLLVEMVNLAPKFGELEEIGKRVESSSISHSACRPSAEMR